MDRAVSSVEWIHDLGQVLAGSMRLDEVADAVLGLVGERLSLSNVMIHLLDEGERMLRPLSLPGQPADSHCVVVGSGPVGQVAATGAPCLVPDLEKSPELRDRSGCEREPGVPYAFVCVPIRLAGRVFGTLSGEMRFVDQAGLEDTQRTLGLVADMLAHPVQAGRLVLQTKGDLLDLVPAGTEPDATPTFQHRNLIGSSRAMLSVYTTLERVATTAATILLVGETGTGKELISKAIHSNSSRKGKPFVAVNCSALPGQLLESELFGHVHGAFTGAVRDKVGRFEAAHEGTLLLDEISTTDVPLQVKLLRVLQEREIERVGDVRTIPVDVRIIVATNEDLAEAVKAGTFREDLYYRLNVVEIHLPPLRERREDIGRLIDHFLDHYNTVNGRELHRLSREMLDLLIRYPWPGNVRELENTIERAVVLSTGEDFTYDLLPPSIRAFADQEGSIFTGDTTDGAIDDALRRCVADSVGSPGQIWERAMTRVERSLIREALDRCGQVKIKAADFLGINRNTLNKKCRELGLHPSAERPDSTAC